MPQISFQRLSDDGSDVLDITDTSVKDNNIIAFKANGTHYHLNNQGNSKDLFAMAAAALAGGGAGAVLGKTEDPGNMLRDAAGGTLVAMLGEFAFKEIQDHRQSHQGEPENLCYVDEKGQDVYRGPVAAS